MWDIYAGHDNAISIRISCVRIDKHSNQWRDCSWCTNQICSIRFRRIRLALEDSFNSWFKLCFVIAVNTADCLPSVEGFVMVSPPLIILSGPNFWKMRISEWTFDFGKKSEWTYSFWVDLQFFLYSEWTYFWISKKNCRQIRLIVKSLWDQA